MSTTPQNKFELDTPCLVLDLDMLESNLQKMQSSASLAGKQLRPHAKTHKCSELAKRQLQAGAVGMCVAKVSEAEALARAGVSGILVTGPLATPRKIERLLDVLAVSPDLMAVIDHSESLELLAAGLRARGLKMDVLLDVDAGLHRTGALPAGAPGLAEEIMAHPEVRLRGIQAYAGQVQHIKSYAERKAASLACLREAAGVFRELQKLSGDCNIFSASGTGSAEIDLAIPELTELQVGSYACMDAEYLAIGTAEDPQRFAGFPPALRLLTTVISCNQPGFVTVDAGLKSLYKDGGVPQVLGAEQAGLEYAWFGDEYGRVSSKAGGGLLALGSVLELVTSHCDPTINLFDRFYLTRGEQVTGEWPIDLRGCSQ
ncbi:MAG TPA: DSD1 family PLP-dependent enzyme [Anaerolineales bacterium]|jgi:D-serine deaminase-like pyridoxal phosphate-dependent protein